MARITLRIMSEQPPKPPPKFVTISSLQDRYDGRSRMYIERLMARPVHPFPRPALGGGNCIRLWDLDAIEQWEIEEAARVAGERKAS